MFCSDWQGRKCGNEAAESSLLQAQMRLPFLTIKDSEAHERGSPVSGREVDALCKHGRLKETIWMFDSMNQKGIHVHFNIYRSLLQGCAKLKALAQGKYIHLQIDKSGLKPSRYLENTLLSMYAKCRSLADARKVFLMDCHDRRLCWTGA